MSNKRQLLLLNLILLFSPIQVIADQIFFEQNCISQARIQVLNQSLDLGSLVSTESLILIKNQDHMAKNMLYAGFSRKLGSIQDLKFENEDQQDVEVLFSFFNAQKLKNFIALSILLLCSSGDTLIGAEQPIIIAPQRTGSRWCPCIPESGRDLVETFATNIAGNGTAVAVVELIPNPLYAGIASCFVGSVGAGLEIASRETSWMSQETTDMHRNFFSGEVADAVCVPAANCYRKSPNANAAAAGSVTGYFGVMGAYFCYKSCAQGGYCNVNNLAQAHRQLVPVAQMEIIER